MNHWWMWHCLSVHPSQVSVVCCYTGLAVFEHGDEPPMDVALSVCLSGHSPHADVIVAVQECRCLRMKMNRWLMQH